MAHEVADDEDDSYLVADDDADDDQHENEQDHDAQWEVRLCRALLARFRFAWGEVRPTYGNARCGRRRVGCGSCLTLHIFGRVLLC